MAPEGVAYPHGRREPFPGEEILEILRQAGQRRLDRAYFVDGEERHIDMIPVTHVG
jgi:hypothetical protein